MTIDVELNSSLILRNEITIPNKLAESAAKIAWLNFEWRYATLVVFNSTMFLGIDAFIRSYRKSVIIGKEAFLTGDEKSGHGIIQFVVFGTDLINIMKILDWMQEREFDNTGKFIFICQNCNESEAMEIFWKHKIINVNFIKNISGSGVAGFTYFPYDENCQISHPVLLEESCTKKPCLDMFPVKLTNFHTCQVIVSTFIQKPYMSLKAGKPHGADGDLLLLIGEALNASLKVMTPHRGAGWGMPGSDGNWTGSLGDIYHDLANFSMTSAAITLTRYQQFHMSKDYNSITMVWVTHPAVPLPAWEKLLHPFQMKARISLAITFSFVVIVAVFVKSRYWVKISKRLSLDPPRSSIIFYSWTICMGMPTTTLPSKLAFLYIFFLWVLYCFMMRTFYQASLIHAMKDNFYLPEFEDLEDILSSGYPLGGVATLKDYFLDEPRVFNNWVGINSTEIYPTMVNLSKGMKYVLAMNMDTTKSFFLDRIGDLHIVPQKIVSSPTVLFFKKFSPMTAALNRLLGRLTEGGFTENFYKNHAAVIVSKPVNDNVPMNIGHYIGCYVILATGWIVSMLLFIFELYFNKLHGLKFRNNCKKYLSR